MRARAHAAQSMKSNVVVTALKAELKRVEVVLADKKLACVAPRARARGGAVEQQSALCDVGVCTHCPNQSDWRSWSARCLSRQKRRLRCCGRDASWRRTQVRGVHRTRWWWCMVVYARVRVCVCCFAFGVCGWSSVCDVCDVRHGQAST